MNKDHAGDIEIPFHRKVGEMIQIQFSGIVHRCKVRQIDPDGTLLHDESKDIFFLETPECIMRLDGDTLKPLKTIQKPKDRNTNQKDNMSNNNDELISITQIMEMVPSKTRGKYTFINNPFRAQVEVVTKFSEKDGSPYHKVWLHDPENQNGKLVAKFWGEYDPTNLNGKVVEFSGNGLTRTEYKSEKAKVATQQVSIDAEKAEVKVLGAGAYSPPSGSRPQNAQKGHSSAPEPVQQHFGSTPHGATVGMALKLAGDLLIAKVTLDRPRSASTDAVDVIRELAWDIILASRELEQRPFAPSTESSSPNNVHQAGPTPRRQLTEEEAWGEAPKSKHEPTWKSVIHQSTKLGDAPLGKRDDSTKLTLAKWALSRTGDQVKALSESGKETYDAVIEMADDITGDLIAAGLASSKVSIDGYERWIKRQYGCEESELSNENLVEILGGFDDVVKRIAEHVEDDEEIPS